MPNHFHFLIHANDTSVAPLKIGSLTVAALNNGFRMLLSSYSQAINMQQGRTGSLFRQKTKFKHLDSDNENYPFICCNYIHQNPLVAGLAEKLEGWEFSSFRDYAGLRAGTLCDQAKATSLLDLNMDRFYEQSYEVINPEKAKGIF